MDKNMKKLLLLLMCSLQLMSANIDWSFPPDAISTAGQDADNPAVAIDVNGNAVAVWVVSGIVKSKSKPADMDWDTEVSVSASGASSPRVVIDSSGKATAVWLENGLIKTASKVLTGGWSSATTLSGSAATAPTMAIDSSGNIIVAWARNGDVQSATKLVAGNWQSAVTINATGSALPHIAIGGSGANTRVAVVWQAVAGTANVVYGASKLLSTSSWGSKITLSDTTHSAGYARVAVDANGNATAVWFAYDASGPNYYRVIVQSSYRPIEAEWGSFTTLSEAGIGNPANLSLRVSYDLLGNAIALWNTTFDNQTFTIQSAIKLAFRGWSDPVNLVTDNLYAYSAHMAVASLGDALALYMFYNGSSLIIQSSELDITGFMDSTWSLPLNLSEGDQNSRPYIATSVNENTVYTAAVWLGVSGMDNLVLASVGTKTVIDPPSCLCVIQSSNDFGVFTEYYNTVSWCASLSSNVTGYLIYRNGVFVEQVAADVLSIVDDNRVQNGPVVYGVAAVDDQNSHSRVMTVSYP
jgi:hypothetical protein